MAGFHTRKTRSLCPMPLALVCTISKMALHRAVRVVGVVVSTKERIGWEEGVPTGSRPRSIDHRDSVSIGLVCCELDTVFRLPIV